MLLLGGAILSYIYLLTQLLQDVLHYSPVLAGVACLAIPVAVAGIGMGLSFVPLTLNAVSSVEGHQSGLASTLLNTSQHMGGSLGLAALVTVAATTARDRLRSLAGARRTPAAGHPGRAAHVQSVTAPASATATTWPFAPAPSGRPSPSWSPSSFSAPPPSLARARLLRAAEAATAARAPTMRRWSSSCASSSRSSDAGASAVAGGAEGHGSVVGELDPSRAPRRAGRVILLDEHDHVLLLAGRDPDDPAAPGWWFTPGGGAEAGEGVADAARRELEEETGLRLAQLGQAVHERRTAFHFGGVAYDQHEVYFLARTARFEPDPTRRTAEERRVLTGHRWWGLDELAATSDTVYPPGLADLLSRVLREPGLASG